MEGTPEMPVVDFAEPDAAHLPILKPEYWEEIFAGEDPWDYDNSEYENWKFAQTLSLVPEAGVGKALEIACAEGHLTARLSPLVRELLAIDISPTAISRARTRCADRRNVDFRIMNIVEDKLPKPFDLILCSEVLFYLPLKLLKEIAPKIAASIALGGHIILAHGNLITDDKSVTGFDWGHPFGAKTIGRVFAELDNLQLIKELRTPLFTVHLLRRVRRRPKNSVVPEILDLPLPADLPLSVQLERTILWGGAEITRDEARDQETAKALPILMYHSVSDVGPAELAPYRVTPDAFRQQLQYLRRHGYYSVTLGEWAACIAENRPLPGRPIILTFDDGYKDFHDNAWPALQRADFSATIFIVADKVGTTADWETGITRPLKLMNWKMLRTLAANGISIGSHSATHKDLSILSADQVIEECSHAREVLEHKLRTTIDTIAFPWGRHTDEAREALSACGYRVGVTTWGGWSTLNDDPLNLPRIEIFGSDDLEAFAQRLQLAPDMTTKTTLSKIDLPEESGFENEGETDEVGFCDPAYETGSDEIGFENDDALLPTAPRMLDAPDAIGFLGSEESPVGVHNSRTERTAPNAVGFDPSSLGAARESDVAPHPDYVRAIGSRLDGLISEFVRLQHELLGSMGASRMTLQKRLTGLFARPVTGRTSIAVRPGNEIAPGVVLSFQESALVTLSIDPKMDHSISPETYLNSIGLTLNGPSEWLAMEVALDWRDLSLAERFQISLIATSNRWISCEAALRFPRKARLPPIETIFARFELSRDDRNAMTSGELRIPDFVEFDTTQSPHLLLFLDASTDLMLNVHYLNFYFA